MRLAWQNKDMRRFVQFVEFLWKAVGPLLWLRWASLLLSQVSQEDVLDRAARRDAAWYRF